MDKKSLVVILGPTGIGKTKTAIEVAKHFNTEIISADSRQIFRELKIGTAVPTIEELHRARHHFIQYRSIEDYYNASIFEQEVMERLDELFQENEVVVMAGGSMLYIDAVCKGIDDLPTVDPELRDSLLETWKEEGLENLRLRLKNLDPEYYKIADLKNPKRILHALEICLMTGKPYSSFRSNPDKRRPFRIIKIGLNCEREKLYDRINRRVDKMIEKGLTDEARSVLPLKHLNALNTVGYKELFAFFEGEISHEEAVQQIKNHTRKYARKQLTWFRKDKQINWFEPGQENQIIQFIEKEVAYGKS